MGGPLANSANLANAEGEMARKQRLALTRITQLNTAFQAQRKASDTRATGGGDGDALQRQRMAQVQAIEAALTQSTAARSQLEQGSGWYAELTRRVAHLIHECRDHAAGQVRS